MPPINSQSQQTTYATNPVQPQMNSAEPKPKSTRKVFWFVVLTMFLFCCLVSLIVGVFALKNTNSPAFSSIKSALGLSTPKEVINQVLDSNYLLNLQNKYTSANSNAQVNIKLQSSIVNADINVKSNAKQDLKSKILNIDEKIGGKVGLGGIVSYDIGDGFLVSAVVDENSQETYYKYSFSDTLTKGLDQFAKGFTISNTSSFIDNLPDKYIKMTKDDFQKMNQSNNLQFSINDLQQNSPFMQDLSNEFKSIILDYEKYATVTQSSQNGMNIYSFTIDSAKLSDRVMQDKAVILALVNKIDKNISEKSISDAITFLKYMNFDKFEFGVKNGYLAQTNVSLSASKDGLNYLNVMQTGTMIASNLTNLSLTANSNYDYSNNSANVVLPNNFYTYDEWNKKVNSDLTKKFCTGDGEYDSETKTCVKIVNEGDSCYNYGGSEERRCANNLKCNTTNSINTGGGYIGTCVKTNNGDSNTSSQAKSICPSGYTFGEGICYKTAKLGESCMFDGFLDTRCSGDNICKLPKDAAVTGGGYGGVCALRTECQADKIYVNFCFSK